MSKPTPGPWTCEPSAIAWGVYRIPEIKEALELEHLNDRPAEYHANACLVSADFAWRRDRPAEDRANAHLISAAPDLLEVAELLLAHALKGGMFNYPAGSLQMLEKAVAKARGRSA